MYENGWGTSRDLGKAILWHRKAAEQGDTDAKDALSRLSEK